MESLLLLLLVFVFSNGHFNSTTHAQDVAPAAEKAKEEVGPHGGTLAAKALSEQGVKMVFTLTGGRCQRTNEESF